MSDSSRSELSASSSDRGQRRGEPDRRPAPTLSFTVEAGVSDRGFVPARRRDLPRQPAGDGAQVGRRDRLVARRERVWRSTGRREPPPPTSSSRTPNGRQPPEPHAAARRSSAGRRIGHPTGAASSSLHPIRTSSGSSPCAPTDRTGGSVPGVAADPNESARRAALVSRRRFHRVHARRGPLRRPARRVGAAIGAGGRRRLRLVAGRTPHRLHARPRPRRSPTPTGAVRRSSRGPLTCTRVEPNSRPTGPGWSMSPSTRPIRRSRTAQATTCISPTRPAETGASCGARAGVSAWGPAWRPAATLPRGTRPCALLGTSRDDVLVGTAHGELIYGRGGNDVIRGRGGDDIIVGDVPFARRPGKDRLFGGPRARLRRLVRPAARPRERRPRSRPRHLRLAGPGQVDREATASRKVPGAIHLALEPAAEHASPASSRSRSARRGRLRSRPRRPRACRRGPRSRCCPLRAGRRGSRRARRSKRRGWSHRPRAPR